MEERHPGADQFFATPVDTFIANIRWTEGEGWRLWVSSWQRGERPARASSSTYTHLSADELLDVLAAEQMTRCEWLRSPVSP